MHLLFRILAALAVLVSLDAFGKAKLMAEAENQTLAPDAGKALVVFLRPSSYGGLINATVYDVTGDAEHFIGVVDDKTKVAYPVEPGQHRFMVIAENADFLESTLEAGKTYYVLVSPRMGVWKARFSLLPIHNDAGAKYSLQSDDFAKWQDKTTLVVKTPAAEAWYAEHKDSVAEKRAKYLKKWGKMLPADKANLTLKPEDGV